MKKQTKNNLIFLLTTLGLGALTSLVYVLVSFLYSPRLIMIATIRTIPLMSAIISIYILKRMSEKLAISKSLDILFTACFIMIAVIVPYIYLLY